MAAVADERRRRATRRGFVGAGAALAGGGLLALAGARPWLAAQEGFADDLDVLTFALTLERMEAAFYRQGLRTFDEAAFRAANRPDSVRPNLEAIRDHEQTHVETLTQAIGDRGGTPVEPAEYDFGYDDVDGFLEVAMALENVGVAAYAGAAPSIENADVLAAALGIHSVEARHAAYLNIRNEESPFPNAVDEAMTRDEVLEAAGGFIVS